MSYDEAMGHALALAAEAAAAGEIPVGAVVLDTEGTVIGAGGNRRETAGNPLAHAEVEALLDASRHLATRERLNDSDFHARSWTLRKPAHGHQKEPDTRVRLGNPPTDNPPASRQPDTHARPWNLAGCTLVVTLEPCPMCAGAALQTHLARIVFGAWDGKLGACGSVWDIPRDPHIGVRPEVVGGVRERECAQLLTDFFIARR